MPLAHACEFWQVCAWWGVDDDGAIVGGGGYWLPSSGVALALDLILHVVKLRLYRGHCLAIPLFRWV
jgi:hypothetical protein